MKHLRIHLDGKSYDVEIEMLDQAAAEETPRMSRVRSSPRAAAPSPEPKPAAAKVTTAAPAGDGAVTSPLAAVVVSIDVAVGDVVEEGANVATLEAMKMNTLITATQAGTVAQILVKAGDAVEEGQSILVIE